MINRIGLALQALWGSRASETLPVILSTWGAGQRVWQPRNYMDFAERGYTRTWVVYACINRIANALARIPLLAYEFNDEALGQRSRFASDGNRRHAALAQLRGMPQARLRARAKALGFEELDHHPALALLRSPSPGVTYSQFVKLFVSYYLTDGNSFVEADRPVQGKPPVALYPMRPDRTIVKAGSDQRLVSGYVYTTGASSAFLEAENVLHLKDVSLTNDFYGTSKIEAAARAIDQHNSAAEYNIALQKNVLRPQGILTLEAGATTNGSLTQALNQKAVDEVVSTIQRLSGEQNAGKSGVLAVPPGYKLNTHGEAMTPHDMSWVEGTMMSMRQICSVFQVPSILVGDPKASTFNNYAEARKAFYEDAVVPLLDEFIQCLNTWLMPMYGGNVVLAYDSDQLPAVQEEYDRTIRSVIALTAAGLITKDEGRERLGYDPLGEDEADDPLGDAEATEDEKRWHRMLIERHLSSWAQEPEAGRWAA